MHSIVSVSYTHLDVYKRQVLAITNENVSEKTATFQKQLLWPENVSMFL